MERLTERDKDGRAQLTNYGKQMYCSTQATADCFAELEERLTKYEQAEADGRLIILPCKVGDVLYMLIPYTFGSFINKFTIPNIQWILENQERIGKTMFFSREQAALSRKEDNNA